MTPRDIGAWILRRWPIVGGALLLTALAVAFALDYGSREVTAEDPTPWPTPDVVFNTPTKEEWAEAFLTVTPIELGPDPSDEPPEYERATAPLSKAHAEYLAAPEGKAVYLPETDKVVHLPDGVWWNGITVSSHCWEECPQLPAYILVTKGEESGAHLGHNGYMVSWGNDDDFAFLSEMGFKKFSGR